MIQLLLIILLNPLPLKITQYDPTRLRVTCTRKKSGISSATRNDPDIRQRDAGAFMVDEISTVEKEKRKRGLL